MTITSSVDARTEPRADEQFIELICADDALVQAEFDAIVAAEWAIPPSGDRTSSSVADGREASPVHHRRGRRFRPGMRVSVRVSSDLVFARSPPGELCAAPSQGSTT
jgi:hypothetical protein